MSENLLSMQAREAIRHIRNSVMHFGKVPSVRELMTSMGYKSPRSAMLLLKELEDEGFLKKRNDGSYCFLRDLEGVGITRTVDVPLLGTVTCGTPLFAEENISAWIPVSITLAKPQGKYFLLRASGDSMNEAGIDDEDLILVKQQSTAENGQCIVALINDEATVKEFQRKGDIIALLPRSTNPVHKPIILDRDFQIQGIVVTAIPNVKI